MSDLADFKWFLYADLSRFAGEWVAIKGKRVVAHSPRFKDVAGKGGYITFIRKGARV